MLRLFETMSDSELTEVVSRFDPIPAPFTLLTRQECSGNVISRKRLYFDSDDPVDERCVHAELNYG